MRRFLSAALTVLAATAAQAQPAPPSASAEQIATPAGDANMPATPTFVLGNASLNNKQVRVTVYGFAEADLISDSTQSLTENAGNTAIARQGTTAGDAGRVQMSARNSRLGIKVESPETEGGIKGMGNLEWDFLGAANGTTEATIYSAPTFRMRHGFVKVQTPWLDLLFGQTWTPFAASGAFQPATVEIQGVPTEIFQRTVQLRVGHTFTAGDFKAELEVAAIRPYQHDSAVPDLGGYLRFVYEGWRGYKATGQTGGDDSGIQLAFSALTRQVRVLDGAPAATCPGAGASTCFDTARGAAFAIDAIIPILPASKKSRANGLTLTAEASEGTGYSDVFSSENAGVTTIGNPPGTTAANYKTGTSLDPGVAGFNSVTGKFDTVDLKSLLLSLQYFLPIDNGNVWVSALYGTLQSDNAVDFAAASSAIADERWVAANLFYDLTPAVRFGLSWSKTRQRLGDNSAPRTNDRVQLSAWYVF